jgi:hypothetical protein
MTQGRVLGRYGLICAATLILSVAGSSTLWSAPPSHAGGNKDATDQVKPGNGRPGNGRWAETSNSTPTISGLPGATVVQDEAYDFLPSAVDPDGDILSFHVTNLPRWATFDTVSGQLFGTPSAGDVGLYSNIVIGVSDGQASSDLPAFEIEVMAYANGVVTLSWAAPTENTDESPLLDLAGYEIHWGPQSGTYSNSVAIANPGIASYVIDNLASGTHYFAMKAVNSRGEVSNFSNEAMATIAP